MKNNSKFKEMENRKEIESYINGLKITRTINKIQLHHMAMPDYDCFEQDKKRWGKNAHLNRTNSLDDYGKKTWNSSDGEGRYIAQHFNVFPDGHITTGRSINSTPIGIKGWNTGAVCIECYGNFDSGHDTMTNEQMDALITLVGSLVKKLKLQVSDKYIRCHSWFTASGTYLGGYHPSKSAKSCPGTEFTKAFGGLVNGYGNSKDAITKYFYPKVKAYIDNNKLPADNNSSNSVTNQPTLTGKYIVRYLQTCLNENYGLDLAVDGYFGPATQAAVSKNYLNSGDKGAHVVWLQKALVNRGFDLDVDGSFGPATLTQLKAYQKSRGLTVDGYGGLGTHQAIIND